jgi:hypothetical protein
VLDVHGVAADAGVHDEALGEGFARHGIGQRVAVGRPEPAPGEAAGIQVAGAHDVDLAGEQQHAGLQADPDQQADRGGEDAVERVGPGHDEAEVPRADHLQQEQSDAAGDRPRSERPERDALADEQPKQSSSATVLNT